MNETAQEYTQRILGYLGGEDPVKILAVTPRKLSKILRGVPRQKLGKKPGHGKWSVGELLAHLADSETVMSFRIRFVLESNGAPIPAYDQNVWATFSNAAKQDPKISLAAFVALRERNVRLLKQIAPGLWEHFGIHSERGKESVRRLAEMLAGHDINHLKQIEAILLNRSKRKSRSRK